MVWKKEYAEKIYAGVTGKLLGVYLGRPVEGWSYEKIRETFGEISYYIHDRLNLPLIVADDDLSGTFGFFRAVEDCAGRKVTAEDIGNSWLNYIIENRSILWWGGLGNSTEHSAYLMLKKGIKAPFSGAASNIGRVMSEQIGAQIFMDAYAMMCPGDPEAAAYYVEQCARVSHDGLAVDAARFLGTMESMAFDEQDVDKIMDDCQRFIQTEDIRRLLHDVRNLCAGTGDYLQAHQWLEEHYGYQNFYGPCPMMSNHAMVLASILLGGDDFQKSLKIATTSAWDTDCNAGNVGCFNGIRLGLDAMDKGADLRTPVADRLYIITSDGGAGVTDAVTESRKIIKAAMARCREEAELPAQRYAFEQRGSLQGFMACPLFADRAGRIQVSNDSRFGNRPGLRVDFNALAEGAPANVSVATFLNHHEVYSNYETYVSPTLYSGQTVKTVIFAPDGTAPYVRLCVHYVDAVDKMQVMYSPAFRLKKGDNVLEWEVPDTGGMPVCRFGYEFGSVYRYSSYVVIRSADWSNTPRRFCQEGILMKDMWDLNPFWSQAFVASARNFSPNLNCTYCISHDEGEGLATIGTSDFTDYQVTSTLKMSLHDKAGLVARSKGHRRFYAAVMTGMDKVRIVKRCDDKLTILGEAGFDYEEFREYEMTFRVKGQELELLVDKKRLLACHDSDGPYTAGGAGFLVDTGSMFIKGFCLERI
ncbi:ADP-ribosylglycohydrolase family protein [Enterocloster sp. OA13]|uniref:ADP-ribosylglycohydrolase family protein n=1 Tax=Enterocloster sp. OA13 TaxID=2914161 RepID=UPI000471DBA9|nr:ADP-ribosylglycohydrolase family protein [Enterocloster sp. OA13]